MKAQREEYGKSFYKDREQEWKSVDEGIGSSVFWQIVSWSTIKSEELHVRSF